jgi:hypothetical protein
MSSSPIAPRMTVSSILVMGAVAQAHRFGWADSATIATHAGPLSNNRREDLTMKRIPIALIVVSFALTGKLHLIFEHSGTLTCAAQIFHPTLINHSHEWGLCLSGVTSESLVKGPGHSGNDRNR